MPRKQPLLHCRELHEHSPMHGHCTGTTGRSVRLVHRTTHKTLVKGRITKKQEKFSTKRSWNLLKNKGVPYLNELRDKIERDKRRQQRWRVLRARKIRQMNKAQS